MPEQLGVLTEEYNPETFLESAAASFSNSILWRYSRDASGAIQTDEDGVPIRSATSLRLLCTRA
jgi:hypothetical protein